MINGHGGKSVLVRNEGNRPRRIKRQYLHRVTYTHTAIVSAQEYDINFYWFTKHDLLSDEMYRSHQRWQQLSIRAL